MFTKNRNIAVKYKIDLYSHCIDCGFRKSKTLKLLMKKKTWLFIRKFDLIIKEYCLITGSVKKNTESRNAKVVKTKSGRIIVL